MTRVREARRQRITLFPVVVPRTFTGREIGGKRLLYFSDMHPLNAQISPDTFRSLHSLGEGRTTPGLDSRIRAWRKLSIVGIVAVLTLAGCSGLFATEERTRGPTFSAEGHDSAMRSLTTLFDRHDAGTLPKATLWDAWLVAPSLWRNVADADSRRAAWRAALLSRSIARTGYVATHQHGSIAHPTGWPFPFWNQGAGVGWHFSFLDTVGPPWRSETIADVTGFELSGFAAPMLEARGFRLLIERGDASMTTPHFTLATIDAPFVQVRAAYEGKEPGRFALEWRHDDEAEFDPHRFVEFEVEPGDVRHVPVELPRQISTSDAISQFRIRALDAPAGDTLVLQAIFSQYDTRHSINESAYLIGCADYLAWTRDREFHASNLARMRAAVEHLIVEYQLEAEGVARNTWVGHDGRSGLSFEGGEKRIHSGVGIGSNYWDLLPFGHDDAYATNYAYAALLRMADIEDGAVDRGIGGTKGSTVGDPKRSASELRELAAKMKAEANRRFFSDSTGRFIGCVDVDGVIHDYGFTFLNLEAIAMGVATESHASSILDWLDGTRIVDGDTSVGADIYSFRFGPRATTRRNVEWYGWFWSGPESIPFGGQVQDGGAVLGFSYFDLMARLRVHGADDAWKRMSEILAWSDEVELAGGYRAYYAGQAGVSLQGCGTPGGLGVDCEFFESALVAQAWIDGFVGFRPRADGSIVIDPRIPSGFESITVSGIRYDDAVLDVSVDRARVTITNRSETVPLELRVWCPDRQLPNTFVLEPKSTEIIPYTKKAR